ncbi:MAG: permease-like cell division protein FtsX [Actinomycetaceae bacterium]|nr:permease-like cell division protein FtsX [Actinomycetaceae bacterium]
MMRFRFIMGRAFTGFFSNFAMTFAVILVTFVSFLFVGIGLLSQVQINNMQQHWYAKVEVSIYMCATEDTSANCHEQAATQAQIDAIDQQLNSSELADYVAKVHFQSNQEAYEEFQKQYAGTPLAEGTTPEMLPKAFRVKLKDPSQYQVIAAAVEGKPGVESVQDQREIVEPLFNLLTKLSLLAFSLAAIQIVAAVLLMMTTIRLSAMVRSKETRIMRFVGASNLFIQMPFMIETTVAALIGALLSIGTLALGMHFGIENWIREHIRVLGVIGLADVWKISPIIIGVSVIFAVIASAIALTKYAKA